MKDFNSVKVGETGISYHGEKYTIIDKGTMREMCEKYRGKQNWTLKEWLAEDGSADDNVVVVKEKEIGLEGYTVSIYIYGYHGMYVKDDVTEQRREEASRMQDFAIRCFNEWKLSHNENFLDIVNRYADKHIQTGDIYK